MFEAHVLEIVFVRSEKELKSPSSSVDFLNRDGVTWCDGMITTSSFLAN